MARRTQAVLLKGWFPAEPFMSFGGILMIGFGAIRILGYFSKDALQLAFQFDLFLGIALAVLGCCMIWDTQAAGRNYPFYTDYPHRRSSPATTSAWNSTAPPRRKSTARPSRT